MPRPASALYELRKGYDEIKAKNQWKRRHHPWTIGLSRQFCSLFIYGVVGIPLDLQKKQRCEAFTRYFYSILRSGPGSWHGLQPGFAGLRWRFKQSGLKIKLTNNIATITVYAPATNANGVFDLYFETDLAVPLGWTWLQRGAPGQTNLVVSNLPPARCFFTLGVTNAIRPGFTNSSLPRRTINPAYWRPCHFPSIFMAQIIPVFTLTIMAM